MSIDRIGSEGIEAGAVAPSDLSTGAPSWDTSGNLSFNSGYGSNGVAYGCRAWVNFNGTSTVAILASGNVSSITDNGTGNYTVNLTTAMPDINFSAALGNGGGYNDIGGARTTSSLQVYTYNFANPPAAADRTPVQVVFFR